jgi:hypothetical protein
MHTTATLHVHPTADEPFRILEVRRIARNCGCTFIPSKSKPHARTAPAPFDPNDGGRAA